MNNRVGRVTPGIWMLEATGTYRDNITYAPDCQACPRYQGGTDIGNNH